MPNPINIQSANQIATLVEFKWGSAGVARYAKWTAALTFEDNIFGALPALEVDYGRQDGSISDTPAVLTMKEVSPLDQMRSTFWPVRVQIWELRPSDGSFELMFKGRITNVSFRHNGRAKAVQVQVSSFKESLQGSLSFLISPSCPNIYGRRPCRAPIESQKETGTITGLDGQFVTVSGLTTTNDPKWWHLGEIQYDGLGISIFSQEAGTGNFTLLEPAPPSWLGKVVSVYPGCGKSIEDCRDPRRNQEDRFNGLGLKIVDRDIRYEE